MRIRLGIALLLAITAACNSPDRASNVPSIPPPTPMPAPEIGRYQVLNVTSADMRGAMLVDTVSGQTWLLCQAERGVQNWCQVQYSEGLAKAVKR
jgi:hypothetical protein